MSSLLKSYVKESLDTKEADYRTCLYCTLKNGKPKWFWSLSPSLRKCPDCEKKNRKSRENKKAKLNRYGRPIHKATGE